MTELAQSFPAAPLALSAFDKCIRNNFGQDTLQKVCDAFQKMGLPRPENEAEFLDATEGALLFLDKYGLVIRIEDKKGILGKRIDDTPWVLQPLATVDVGRAVIEICPGCHVGEDEEDGLLLIERLRVQGVNYWDEQICNGGRLPIKMPSFPEGVPVVIDRLAVRWLQDSISEVGSALAKKQTAEAEAAQEQLYGPLRRIFKECWAGSSMKAFWDACADHKRQGKLISGWAEAPDDDSKTNDAKLHGEEYGQRLESAKDVLPVKTLNLVRITQ